MPPNMARAVTSPSSSSWSRTNCLYDSETANEVGERLLFSGRDFIAVQHSSAGWRLQIVDGQVRKRANTRQQRRFVDEKPRRVVLRCLSHVGFWRDAKEEEKTGNFAL